MCYYDQYKMWCGCFKWGHFREHCTKEYRTGETCGTQMVMKTYEMDEDCKFCQKIITKMGRIQKEKDRIRRWKNEKGRVASTAASEEIIDHLEAEIEYLMMRRDEKFVALGVEGHHITVVRETAGKQTSEITVGDSANHNNSKNGHTIPPARLGELLEEVVVGDCEEKADRGRAQRRCEECQRFNLRCDAAMTKLQPDSACTRCIRLKLNCIASTINADQTFASDTPPAQAFEYEREIGEFTSAALTDSTPQDCKFFSKASSSKVSDFKLAIMGAEDDADQELPQLNSSNKVLTGIDLGQEEFKLLDPSSDDIPDNVSEASSRESRGSDFSTLTTSSMSSIGGGPEADQNLFTILTGSRLDILYAQIFESMSANVDEFRKTLRRSLILFASSLKKEASGQKEKYVARIILYRYRHLAHLIAASLSDNMLRVDKDKDMDVPINDAEVSDFEDDDGFEDPDIYAAERFILQSNALRDFKASLVDLIQPVREIQAVQMVEVESPREESVLEKIVDVSWKCSCGTIFKEQVVEFKEGAAQKLAQCIDSRTSIDIERQVGSESCAESSASETPASSKPLHQRALKRKSDTDTEISERSVIEDCAEPEDKMFILLCRDSGNEARLHHADVSEKLCDYSSYHVLHAKYYGRLKGFWKWMTLREIRSIEFVKFHLYWKTNVSIEREDFGELPPNPSEEYSYIADTNPPVLKTALRHFIENPSHAPKHPHHRPRIPKKIREPLLLDKSLDAREGYGLYIQERICWRKVFAVEAVFATACMIFAIVWCIKNRGGIQDGFAIAGTGIAYGTIILGASQAVAQNHWR